MTGHRGNGSAGRKRFTQWRCAAAAAVLLTAFLAGAGTSAPEAGPEPRPVPELDQWEAHMVRFGRALCDSLAQPLPFDDLLNAVYYDAQRVFYQIAEYTRDPAWLTCAQRAGAVYRDQYVLPRKGAVPGYWNFTHGLAMDYLRTGDIRSKNAVILLAENAAFARDGTPLAWTAPETVSREVAYAIMSYLDAELLGAPRRTRLPQLVDQALGHIEQWFVTKTYTRIAPFMVGLTAEALILYHEKTRDPRIPPAIKTALDWLWANAWVSKDRAFWYESLDKTRGASDLNLLIAPAYAWLYRHTGDPVYRDRGDQIFTGGVKGAWVGSGKQFNQNYRWSFAYVKWRSDTASRLPPGRARPSSR